MPRRQLPWVSKGGSRTEVKQATKEATRRSIPSNIDDDFFDGTILENSRKEKERADAQDSDDELPELPANSFETARTDGESSGKARMLSSSPPPDAADLPPPPKTEYMLKGVDKFDLRDDEWMMVEDELLHTAKLFTKHAHLAEYETLKVKIEEKRKEALDRPVVPGAKPGVEGHFNCKAKQQIRNQEKAIKEALSSMRQGDSKEDEKSSGRPAARKFASSLAPVRPANISKRARDEPASDSDDLDAPKRPMIITSTVISKTPVARKPAQDTVDSKKSTVAKPSAEEKLGFKKPALPTAITKQPRSRLPNLWGDWDQLNTNTKASIGEPSSSKTPQRAFSHPPIKTQSDSHSTSTSKRSTTTATLDDLNTPMQKNTAKGISDRLAKRKADKEREDKNKSAKFDDIPTFLY